ncbi:hypothetical protein Tco_1420703 [Tanacetum coccineum]
MVLNRHVTARDLVSKDKMILEWRGWGGVEQTLGPQMPLYSQLEGIGSSVGPAGLLPVIMQQQMQTSQNQITFPKAHDTEARTIFLAIIMYCNFARLEVQPGKIPNSPGYTFHSPEIARSPKEARTFP